MAQGVLALGFFEQAHAREHASRAPFLFLGRLPAPSLLTDGMGCAGSARAWCAHPCGFAADMAASGVAGPVDPYAPTVSSGLLTPVVSVPCQFSVAMSPNSRHGMPRGECLVRGASRLEPAHRTPR